MNEERFAAEVKKIQSVIAKASQKAGALSALSDGGKMSREKLQLTLEETAYFFEAATLHLRALCETQMTGIGGYGRRDGLEFQLPSGHIEIAGAGWVHMQIDTLLPHCRYMPATWLTDTVRQLLTAYMSGQPLVCATLQNAEGKQAKVYAQGSHPALTPGAQLYDAQITMRKQGNVAFYTLFYTLDGYQVVQQAA